MSSDLERLLRDARAALPEPDEPGTERARRRAVGAVRPRRRSRVLVLAAAMLVTAVVLGVSAGSLNAPGVTAAREPAALGFVPEPGWFALQSPPPAIEGQQTVSAAANVPFAADDVDDGLVESSGLPYSTLLTLPSDGIVIVGTMTPRAVPHVAPVPTAPNYPDVELPLRLRDALPVHHWGAQVRPDQPTAQYHLRAHLRGYDVDLVVYFGTARPSDALFREAQRQLNGFVVRPDDTSASRKSAVKTSVNGPAAVVDRTFTCDTVLLGGLYVVEVRAHAGQRSAGEWGRLPYASVSTGGFGGRADPLVPPTNLLAWVTAGPPTGQTTVDDAYYSFLVRSGGTLGRNAKLCRPARTRIPLARTGLRGGNATARTRTVDCTAPRRVLVRIRSVSRGPASLRAKTPGLVATDSTLTSAELAVRTPSGKPLVYATVDQRGRTRLYTAPRGCRNDS